MGYETPEGLTSQPSLGSVAAEYNMRHTDLHITLSGVNAVERRAFWKLGHAVMPEYICSWEASFVHIPLERKKELTAPLRAFVTELLWLEIDRDREGVIRALKGE